MQLPQSIYWITFGLYKNRNLEGENPFSSNILILFDTVSISGYSLFQCSSISLGLCNPCDFTYCYDRTVATVDHLSGSLLHPYHRVNLRCSPNLNLSYVNIDNFTLPEVLDLAWRTNVLSICDVAVPGNMNIFYP